MHLDLKNWMAELSDDLLLSEITLPGTHDSATQFVSFSDMARCQDKSIYDQLRLGTRFLDIRLKRVGGSLQAVHSTANCRIEENPKSAKLCLEDILAVCRHFLEKHPTEAIVMSIKKDFGLLRYPFFDLLFQKYLSKEPALWFCENRIPRLSECRGKIVFFRRCKLNRQNKLYTDQNTGMNLSKWKDQKSKRSDNPLVCTLRRLDDNAPQKAILQDRYGHTPMNKWNHAVKPCLEAPPTDCDLFVSFLSTAGGKNPYASAKEINEKFMLYPLKEGKQYGWLLLDFANEDLNKKIIRSNFK